MMHQEVTPLELQCRIAEGRLISNFDIDNIETDALLFQTGYLTITNSEGNDFQTFYTLDYPNLEVRQSLSQELLRYLGRQGKQLLDQGWELGRLLKANNFVGFMDCLKALFAGFPINGNQPIINPAMRSGMQACCMRVFKRLALTFGLRRYRCGDVLI